MAIPAPKRRESYQKYVSRVFKYAKRNKNAVKGAYTGKGKNRTFKAAPVMKKIGVEWRKHTRKMGGKK